MTWLSGVHQTPTTHNLPVHCEENKARPFPWKAEWVDIITGELEIVDPFTSNATPRLTKFEAGPPVGRTFP